MAMVALKLVAAIARLDGTPHQESIFLHSKSAVGCNARRVPFFR